MSIPAARFSMTPTGKLYGVNQELHYGEPTKVDEAIQKIKEGQTVFVLREQARYVAEKTGAEYK